MYEEEETTISMCMLYFKNQILYSNLSKLRIQIGSKFKHQSAREKLKSQKHDVMFVLKYVNTNSKVNILRRAANVDGIRGMH